MRLVLGALVAGVAFMAGRARSEHFKGRVDQAGDAPDRREPPDERQPSRAALRRAEDEARADEKRHKRRECAYWIVTGLASVAATGAAIGAATYAKGAYNAAFHQAAIARAALVASERPWLSIEGSAAGPLGFEGGEARMPVSWTVKNHGRTPAQAVAVVGGLSVSGPEDVRIPDCRSLRDGPEDNRAGGPIIFPDQKLMITQTHRAHIPARSQTDGGGGVEPFVLLLQGCVGYFFTGSDARHATPIAYMVGEKLDEGPNTVRLFGPELREVPADRILTGRTLGWSGPAD